MNFYVNQINQANEEWERVLLNAIHGIQEIRRTNANTNYTAQASDVWRNRGHLLYKLSAAEIADLRLQ